MTEPIEQKLKRYVFNSIHGEAPTVAECDNYISIATETWIPSVYSLATIEQELGLVYHGELDGEYIFRSKSV